jgi:hypothetical protein
MVVIVTGEKWQALGLTKKTIQAWTHRVVLTEQDLLK